jgi:hypothetical protein
LFLSLLIILFLWKAAFKEIKSDNGAHKYFCSDSRKINYLSSCIRISRPKNGKKYLKYLNKKVMTGHSFKFDRDGPISKTPICYLQNGLMRSCKRYTRATLNSDQSGALSSERSPAGILYESYRTENKIKNKFYGNIRIFLRFVVNYFNNTKEDTMWIHKINPSILNDIYKGT